MSPLVILGQIYTLKKDIMGGVVELERILSENVVGRDMN